MKYTLLKIGTDAEVFLSSAKGTPFPVVGLLGGTKQKPLPVKNFREGFSVQEDNVMAEFNIPPADNAREFSANIEQMLLHLKEHMRQYDLDLAIKASMHFPLSKLRTKQAQTFGCEPDMCAWTGEENLIDRDNPELKTLRTAAAHIHVSYLVDDEVPHEPYSRILAVRAHDLFLGVPGILLDSDEERRKIYGKAGAFRNTVYGHEYRTPSNFWIESERYRQWTFDQTQKALEFVSTEEGEATLLNDENVSRNIQHAINNHSELAASWLCHRFGIQIP